MRYSAQASGSFRSAVDAATQRAAASLMRRQSPEGYWWAHLTADSTLESDYIFGELWLHPPVNGNWDPPTRDKIDRAAQSILRRQLDDGGFNIYHHGPSEISASVKAYFALKLAGIPVGDGRMLRLRNRILEMGGVQAANSYVRINLSLFGLYPREETPSIPPEIILLPFNFIYQMSSWTRAIVVPLSIIHASNSSRPVPAGFTLEELFLPGAPMRPLSDIYGVSWRNFFLWLDRALKAYERYAPKFLRKHAINKCAEWMLQHLEGSDGLGAIYPSMQYSIMALDLLGYAPDHPVRAKAQHEFDRLMVDDGERFYMQPCFSPVWDTAIAAYALGESGVDARTPLRKVADWLLKKEVRRKGDWSKKRPKTEPSGWAFEFNNEFYPDVDDTAMVLLAFKHAQAGDPAAQQACVERAVKWLFAMQGKDGGWAAFDVDNNWKVLSHVPFADHNAMLDPSCPDITGRVLEALIASGVDESHPAIQRGVAYLLRTQEQDGSWYGRWGVDYIYGTFLAVRGLRSAGLSENEPSIQQALEFIRAYQNVDGGWGETCASYDENRFVPGASTPSQTAWAILTLLAGGDMRSESLYNGLDYLVRTQRADGTWHEDLCTGTGFPRVFYLCYTEYRNMFPLLALSVYRKHADESQEETAQAGRFSCAGN